MRKFVSLFLIFVFIVMPCISLACENSTNGTEPTFVPSITLSDLYATSGPVDIFDNPKFDYRSMLRSFSENVVDCVPLILWTVDGVESRRVYFDLAHPNNDMESYDCFIINSSYDVIGNVTCEYCECTCGEWWYGINVMVAPGKYNPEQVIYLVWVE